MRTAVVTGAASERGIGRGLALRLAREGWALALIDLDGDGVENLAAELVAMGTPAVGLRADITDDDSVDRAVAVAERDLPPIAGLANVAGISNPTPFLELDRETWDRVLRVNLTGTFVVTRRVVPGMVGRGYGRVVCLSSTAAQTGGGNYSTSAYAASKAGIEGMARGLAREVAPSGVTVNCISPATIDTDIMGGPITQERLPQFLATLPVGRIGTVDDVTALMAFLMGPEAGYITGTTVNINGGLRIG
ncbi:MAG TPA: SDR family NAD(P)-dependent oxidoreductase [Pseudolysinimonas sp.]|nr:SDR family NAD(P)-dependent oxidoreductase [Pseudolysinimonas sp.]